jgi:hypothetical protein
MTDDQRRRPAITFDRERLMQPRALSTDADEHQTAALALRHDDGLACCPHCGHALQPTGPTDIARPIEKPSDRPAHCGTCDHQREFRGQKVCGLLPPMVMMGGRDVTDGYVQSKSAYPEAPDDGGCDTYWKLRRT